MRDLYEYALPIAALLLGTFTFLLTKLQSRTFDRRVKDAGDNSKERRATE